MNRRSLLAVVTVLVLVGLLGTGSVIAFGATGPEIVDSVLGDRSDPPALERFVSAGAQCTEKFAANSSSSVVFGVEYTRITYSRNVSLPGPSYSIGGPTFERINESTYVLDVPIEETEKAPRACPGVARYNGTIRIPAGADPWHLVIKHDGQTVTRLSGDSNRSVLGGSASVSQSVSAPESTANSTTTSE